MEKGWGLEKGSPELGLRKGLPGIEWTKPLFWAAKLEARSEGTIREKGERKGIEMREQGKKKGVGRGVDWRSEVPFTSFASSSSLSTSLSVYAREERRKKGLSISRSTSCSLFQLLLQRRLTDCAVNLFVGSKHSPSLAHGSITPVILFREENRTVSFRESRYWAIDNAHAQPIPRRFKRRRMPTMLNESTIANDKSFNMDLVIEGKYTPSWLQ